MNETPETDTTSHSRGLTRRNLIYGFAGTTLLLGLGGAARYVVGDTSLLRPPGGQDENHLLSTCIKCNRCISVCPTNVISVAELTDGLINARTPRLDYRAAGRDRFSSGEIIEGVFKERGYEEGRQILTDAHGANYCNFCNLCVENCPTGALGAFDPATQWIGLAKIATDRCIAYERVGGCRKCVDFCPFSAVSLDKSQYPVIDASRCNGCGVCENICPTDSYRSYKGTNTRRGVNVEVSEEARTV
jgi:ferredoxin-type protein NapG